MRIMDIQHPNKVGSNQHKAEEKWTVRFVRFIKTCLVIALILTAAGGIIYAKVTKYVGDKEQSILKAQLVSVQGELDILKGQK